MFRAGRLLLQDGQWRPTLKAAWSIINSSINAMIGRHFQQYVVVDKAGEGGMGVVWKARDTRLDRDAALKLLPDRITDPHARERFIREAKSASALNHPNIVTIYEIDSDDGVDFIAMEFIAGETLARQLAGGALEVPIAIAYARQIADALSCAHQAGIIHRDLKPGNIMITAAGTLKVLDFGLAKPALRSDTPVAETPTFTALTQDGIPVGTPDYMSPEQALGDAVDARSDVFSFGVVLYLMLTGKLPFQGGSRSDALRRLHFDSPTPVTTVRPGVPPRLAAVVAKAMEKRPDDRYSSMIEVRQVLDQVDYVPLGRPETHSVFDRFRQSWQLRAVAALALVISIAWGIQYWHQRPTAAPPSASAANNGAALQPQSPHELTQRGAQLLQRPDRPENIEQAIGLLEEALRLQPRHASAHAYLADAYRRKNGSNPDPQWARLAAESARRALELSPDLALAHSMQGFVHYDNGRFSEAEAEWRRAIELDPTSPFPYLGLGSGYAAQRRDSEAESQLREAVKRRGSDWRPDGELGSFFIRRGRFSEALASYEAARQLAPDNTIVWRNIGAAYFQLERYEDAAAAFQRSLEILPSAAVYTNLGTLRFFQGRYHDAVPAFEKAVELGANRALYWGNLADAYRWAPGRRGESLAAYDRAVALLRDDVAKQPSNPELKTRLAAYLVKSRRPKEALDVIADIERSEGLPSPVLKQLALVQELAGNRERALHFVDRALQAGYSAKEIANDPELTTLRADMRYHAIVASRTAKTR